MTLLNASVLEQHVKDAWDRNSEPEADPKSSLRSLRTARSASRRISGRNRVAIQMQSVEHPVSEDNFLLTDEDDVFENCIRMNERVASNLTVSPLAYDWIEFEDRFGPCAADCLVAEIYVDHKITPRGANTKRPNFDFYRRATVRDRIDAIHFESPVKLIDCGHKFFVIQKIKPVSISTFGKTHRATEKKALQVRLDVFAKKVGAPWASVVDRVFVPVPGSVYWLPPAISEVVGQDRWTVAEVTP